MWVCTWFTCDGKARDGVKAGKDRDLSALDAPAEPAGTAEGPSFTARALSWVLSLLCAAVACVAAGVCSAGVLRVIPAVYREG